MRRSPRLRCHLLLLFTALTGLLGLVAAGPAAAFVMAPGDNGDVKIHASTTPVGDTRNEPKVCVFYLDAFNFDGLQQVSWHINQQPPTGKQVDYCRALGWQGTIESKAHASEIIDRLKPARAS